MEEFKKFILRGNVMDMAVGVIVGGAFTAIVTSLNADILTPILGLFGGTDFSYLCVKLGSGYYSEIPTELVVRDADDVSAQLAQLFKNVKNNKDLDNTILNLEEKFCLAISEDYNDYTNYINDIGWNLAIAHLKDGERDDAVKTLELLISHSESDIVIEKCKKLIEEIKEL